MKILFVTARDPSLFKDGGAMRALSLLKALSRDHEVAVLYFSEGGPSPLSQLGKYCKRMASVERGPAPGFSCLIKALLTLIPPNIIKYRSAAMAEKYRELAGEYSPDLVFIEHLHLAYLYENSLHIPGILDEQNLEYRIWRKKYRLADNLPAKLFYYALYAATFRYEKKAASLFDLCLVPSPVEKKLLGKIREKNMTPLVLPNIPDLPSFAGAFTGRAPKSSPALLFTGSLDWKPNIDGMKLFISSAYREIKRSLPRTKLVIAGCRPDKFFRSLRDPSIRVVPDPPDMEPFFREADIFICPVTYGGGTRIKILEAAAYGLPVISTYTGAEGLGFRSGMDILKCGIGEFPAAVAALSGEPGLSDKLARAAGEKLAALYSPGILPAMLTRHIGSVFESRAGTPMITVAVPVKNEERNIRQAIESVLAQDYPKDRIEMIFADGLSKDNTVRVIEDALQGSAIPYKILSNPGVTTPSGLNMIIRVAKGDIIARLDGHSEFSERYLKEISQALSRKCVTSAGAGVRASSGSSPLGKLMLGSAGSFFGSGGSVYRTGERPVYVNTLQCAAYKKKVFDIYGLFNEKMLFSEDEEYNYRLFKAKEKQLLLTKSALFYKGRENFTQLARQYFNYGCGRARVILTVDGFLKLKHLAPPVLTLTAWLFLVFLFFGRLDAFLALFLLIYFLTLLLVSMSKGPWALIIFPVMHFSYGWGFITGLLKNAAAKYSI